jgi:hypothetical protein
MEMARKIGREGFDIPGSEIPSGKVICKEGVIATTSDQMVAVHSQPNGINPSRPPSTVFSHAYSPTPVFLIDPSLFSQRPPGRTSSDGVESDRVRAASANPHCRRINCQDVVIWVECLSYHVVNNSKARAPSCRTPQAYVDVQQHAQTVEASPHGSHYMLRRFQAHRTSTLRKWLTRVSLVIHSETGR